MKFSIAFWPTQRFLIDNGFIRATNGGRWDDYIDTDHPEWAFLLAGPLVGGRPPPIDAIPRDDATYNLMVLAYGPTRVPRVVPIVFP